MCHIIEIHARNTQNQEIADKWQRKAVSLHQTLLVLEDHNGSIGGTTQIDANVADHRMDNAAQPFTGTAPPLIHVVAHTRYEDRSRDGFLSAIPQDGVKLIMLHVSSAGPVQKDSDVSVCDGLECVWLSVKDHAAYCDPLNRWAKQFLSLNYSEAEELARTAKTRNRAAAGKFEGDYSHLLDLILPGRVENLLAFRFLCEATKACDGKPQKENAFDTGLTIHAPHDLGEWLIPFGKKPEDEGANDQVAGMIGSDEIKKKAKAVLDAVNGSGKLDEAIDAFLIEVA